MRRLWLQLGIGLVWACCAIAACRHNPRLSVSREPAAPRSATAPSSPEAAPPVGKPTASAAVAGQDEAAPLLTLPATEPPPMEIVAQPEQSASSGKGIAASTLSEQGQEATSERILPATLSGPKLLSRQAGRDSAHSGHAPDYGWLVGELHYVHVRDVWCLRYAAPEEDDRYGGRVTLVDTGAMTAYRNGQMVRVEGRLCDPDSREPSPAYRVQAIRPLP